MTLRIQTWQPFVGEQLVQPVDGQLVNTGALADGQLMRVLPLRPGQPERDMHDVTGGFLATLSTALVLRFGRGLTVEEAADVDRFRTGRH